VSETLSDRIWRLRGHGVLIADRTIYQPIKKIVCKDGFHMSVQASETHYCTPRNSQGPWHKFEVGYPSAKVDEFMPYIEEGISDPTETVYGYVPGEVIEKVIAAHGGIDEAAGVES
jgi:hypothetical protein